MHFHCCVLFGQDLLESEKDGNDIFAFRDSNIGCLALECRMHELQAFAQQYKVRIERKDPYGQNSHLVVTGKLANVKQCLADVNAWESALRLHQKKIQVRTMMACSSKLSPRELCLLFNVD